MRIFKNFLYKTFLILILSSTTLGAAKRVDFDLRLEPKSEKYFYLLKESFNNKEVIVLAGNTYKIIKSQTILSIVPHTSNIFLNSVDLSK